MLLIELWVRTGLFINMRKVNRNSRKYVVKDNSSNDWSVIEIVLVITNLQASFHLSLGREHKDVESSDNFKSSWELWQSTLHNLFNVFYKTVSSAEILLFLMFC